MSHAIMLGENVYSNLELIKNNQGRHVSWDTLLQQILVQLHHAHGSHDQTIKIIQQDSLKLYIEQFYHKLDHLCLIAPGVEFVDVLAPMMLLCLGDYPRLFALMEARVNEYEKIVDSHPQAGPRKPRKSRKAKK